MAIATAPSAPVWTFGLDPDRARMALRTAAACAISLAIVLIYRFPKGDWALITCLVMTQASVGASIDKGVSRALGTMVACALAVTVLAPLNQSPVSFLLSTFGIISVAAYLGTGSVYPYAFVIGGVTLVMVSVLGFEGQNVSVSLGLARTGEIFVGIAVSWLTAIGLWPRLASEELDSRARSLLIRTREAFRQISTPLSRGESGSPSYREELSKLAPEAYSILALVPPAMREAHEQRHHAVAWRRLATDLERLRASLVPLGGARGQATNRLARACEAETRVLCDAILRAWDAIAEGHPPADRDAALRSIRPAARAVERRLDAIRSTPEVVAYSATESLGFHGTLGALREIENTLNAISHVDDVGPPPPIGWRTRLRAYRPDRLRLRYALKTGLAVCLAIGLLNVLQWEGSVSAMITTFIVAQLSIGGSVRKAFLRFAGALCGGLLALAVILFLIPQMSTLPPFAVVVFVVMFGCAYVYTGPERSAYAGLQTGLAFVLVLVAGPQQEVSVMPAVSRLVGVLLGTAISIGVETLLWPTHAYIEVRSRVRQVLGEAADLFERLAQGLEGQAPVRAARLAELHQVREDITSARQLLGDALLEGREARERIANDLPVASAAEELLHRLGRLALRFDRPVPDGLREPLSSALGDHLATLQATLRSLPTFSDGHGEPSEASAALRAANRQLVERLESLRQSGGLHGASEEDLSYTLGLVDAVLRIAQGTVALCDSLSRDVRT